MKQLSVLVLTIVACISMTGCRSYYAASTEAAYQESLNAMKAEMANDGYLLASLSVSNGYHDKEIFSFSNNSGETVQFTYEVHRGEHRGGCYGITTKLTYHEKDNGNTDSCTSGRDSYGESESNL